MARKTLSSPFVEEMKRQLTYLRDAAHGYQALHVYVSGVSGPWEFASGDEFEFHDDTGVLIVRDGPGRKNDGDHDAPEYVFRLEAVVATQLV